MKHRGCMCVFDGAVMIVLREVPCRREVPCQPVIKYLAVQTCLHSQQRTARERLLTEIAPVQTFLFVHGSHPQRVRAAPYSTPGAALRAEGSYGNKAACRGFAGVAYGAAHNGCGQIPPLWGHGGFMHSALLRYAISAGGRRQCAPHPTRYGHARWQRVCSTGFNTSISGQKAKKAC